jgi:hypothetical protein
MSKTYEELAAENYPKELLPLDEGKHCPPFEATLYRLAEAVLNTAKLTPELEEIKGHLKNCAACDSKVKRLIACLDSLRTNPLIDEPFPLSLEKSDYSKLHESAAARSYIPGHGLFDVFLQTCYAAGVSEHDAYKAMRVSPDFQTQLKKCTREGIELLSDLGIERTVIERAVEMDDSNHNSRREISASEMFPHQNGAAANVPAFADDSNSV